MHLGPSVYFTPAGPHRPVSLSSFCACLFCHRLPAGKSLSSNIDSCTSGSEVNISRLGRFCGFQADSKFLECKAFNQIAKVAQGAGLAPLFRKHVSSKDGVYPGQRLTDMDVVFVKIMLPLYALWSSPAWFLSIMMAAEVCGCRLTLFPYAPPSTFGGFSTLGSGSGSNF